MKVLDLQCGLAHTFEGWFASEEDFVQQCAQSLIECPVCGDSSVEKKLSAPRLMLSVGRADGPSLPSKPVSAGADSVQNALVEAWLTVSRQVIAHTTDVGDQFAEEARKVHYGEREACGIRGTATMEEAQALVEEGIEVVPLLLPEAMKGSLQ